MITSIKHKALITFISFTLGLTALYLGLAVVSAFVVEDGFINRMLNLEVRYTQNYYEKHGGLPPPRFEFVSIYQSKSEMPEFAQQAVDQFSIDKEIFSPGNEHYHFDTIQLSDGREVYLLAEVSPLLIVTNNPAIFGTFIGGLILTLAIAIWLAVKMSNLTVNPVMALTQAIKHKTQIPKLEYELGYLADTLQQAFDDLATTLNREKEFTTDVSHELRTPLTVLHNVTTLAQQRGLNNEDLSQLKQVSQQMQHTVDVLLALARSEAIEQCNCPLKSMLEQAAMQSIIASGKTLDLKISIPEEFQVKANPSLLHLMLTNLINNAISHASNERLSVSLENNELIFHNQTQNSIKSDIFQSGIKSDQSQGIGQGLYLVTRILESLGWQHQLMQSESSFAIKISL